MLHGMEDYKAWDNIFEDADTHVDMLTAFDDAMDHVDMLTAIDDAMEFIQKH